MTGISLSKRNSDETFALVDKPERVVKVGYLSDIQLVDIAAGACGDVAAAG
jgi:hypothetical protein